MRLKKHSMFCVEKMDPDVASLMIEYGFTSGEEVAKKLHGKRNVIAGIGNFFKDGDSEGAHVNFIMLFTFSTSIKECASFYLMFTALINYTQ